MTKEREQELRARLVVLYRDRASGAINLKTANDEIAACLRELATRPLPSGRTIAEATKVIP